MKFKIFFLAISYTLVLAASVPVKIQANGVADAAEIKQQNQETWVSLSSNALSKPHFLRINTLRTGTQISGKIKLDGKYIKKLDGDIEINLAPFLTPGKHAIDITGTYHPSSDSVRVEFIGPATQVSQQTGGNGDINQTIIIEVE
jgi:hypothetical protein